MTPSFAAAIAEPPTGRRRAVLLDSHDYAQAVFLQGKAVPWHEPTAYANFVGQAQGILASDLVLLSLDRFYTHRVETTSDLRQAMGTRSRTGYALRTLLADADTTRLAVELATVFTRTQRNPVVLQIPSPMQWLVRTHHFSASTDLAELDADDAENASMYVADWLRGFADLNLAAILLDDRTVTGGTPPVTVPVTTYSPVANVTDHYRWALAQRSEAQIEVHGTGRLGSVVPPGFWLDDDGALPDRALPDGDFLLGEIPPTAVPEFVLARVAGLD